MGSGAELEYEQAMYEGKENGEEKKKYGIETEKPPLPSQPAQLRPPPHQTRWRARGAEAGPAGCRKYGYYRKQTKEAVVVKAHRTDTLAGDRDEVLVMVDEKEKMELEEERLQQQQQYQTRALQLQHKQRSASTSSGLWPPPVPAKKEKK